VILHSFIRTICNEVLLVATILASPHSTCDLRLGRTRWPFEQAPCAWHENT
jgi:hypothetical protein